MAIKPAGLLARPFHFVLSLIIAGVIVAGFSHTVSTRLIHPPSPRPVILYVHAALSAGWIVLFITQTALICTRNVKYAARLVCVRSRLALQSPLWEFQQRSLWEDCMCNAETRETPMPRRL